MISQSLDRLCKFSTQVQTAGCEVTLATETNTLSLNYTLAESETIRRQSIPISDFDDVVDFLDPTTRTLKLKLIFFFGVISRSRR